MRKTCPACHNEKSTADFYCRRDGSLVSECKACTLARRKLHYELNRDEVRKRNNASCAKFRLANLEAERARVRAACAKNRDRGRNSARQWRLRNPEKHCAKEALRRAGKLKATPTWANLSAIEVLYSKAQALSRETGVLHHVDHIIPLNGVNVSGLHVEYNLQVITAFDNISKSNRLIA